MSRYDVKSILESSTLPIGGAAKRLKDVEAQAAEMTVEGQRRDDHHDNMTSSQLSDGTNSYHGWPTIAFQQQQPYSMHYPTPYGQRVWCKQEQDSDNVHGFQDHHLHHQLQLGNTHNFFQQNSVVHNLMGMESGSMQEHSSAGSNNSVIYSSSQGGNGYGNHGGYVIPMSTVIGNNDHQQHQGNSNGFVGESDEERQVKALGYENHVFASTDPYHHAARNNVYYLSHQSTVLPGVVKASAYDHDHDHDQGSTCNNWVPTAVPTVKQYGCTLPWSSNVHTTTLE